MKLGVIGANNGLWYSTSSFKRVMKVLLYDIVQDQLDKAKIPLQPL